MAKKSIKKNITESVEKLITNAQNVISDLPMDLVSAIKMDHESLRNFLGTLKDTDAKKQDRLRAYDSFSALLESHTDIEEQLVYKTTFKLTGKEMHTKVAEGFVEHQMSKDLMARIKKTTNHMTWSAHVNVLSEIIEHHLKEEERDLLPLIGKQLTAKQDQALLKKFLQLRNKTQAKVNKKNAGALKKIR